MLKDRTRAIRIPGSQERERVRASRSISSPVVHQIEGERPRTISSSQLSPTSPMHMSPQSRAKQIRRPQRVQSEHETYLRLGPYYGVMVNVLQLQQLKLQRQRDLLFRQYSDVRDLFAREESFTRFMASHRLEDESLEDVEQAEDDAKDYFDWSTSSSNTQEGQSASPPKSTFETRIQENIEKLQAESKSFCDCQQAIDDSAKVVEQLVAIIKAAALEYSIECNSLLKKKNDQAIRDRLTTAGIIFSCVAPMVYSAEHEEFIIQMNQDAHNFSLDQILMFVTAHLKLAVARNTKEQAAQDKANQQVVQLIKRKIEEQPILRDQISFTTDSATQNIVSLVPSENGKKAHENLEALMHQREALEAKYAPLVSKSRNSSDQVSFTPASMSEGSDASVCVMEYTSLTKRIEAAQVVLKNVEAKYRAERELITDFVVTAKRDLKKKIAAAEKNFKAASQQLQKELDKGPIAYATIQAFQAAKLEVEKVDQVIDRYKKRIDEKFVALEQIFDGHAVTNEEDEDNALKLKETIETFRGSVTLMQHNVTLFEMDSAYVEATENFAKGEQIKEALRFLRDDVYSDYNLEHFFAPQVVGPLGGEKVDVENGDRQVRIARCHASIVKRLRAADIEQLTTEQAAQLLSGGFNKENPLESGLRGIVSQRGKGTWFGRQVRQGPTEDAYVVYDKIPENILSLSVAEVVRITQDLQSKMRNIEDKKPEAKLKKLSIHDPQSPRAKEAQQTYDQDGDAEVTNSTSPRRSR